MSQSSNNQSFTRGWRPTDILSDATRALQLVFHPNVPLSLKLLLPAAALAYLVMPLDLLPGPIDDVAVLLIAMRVFLHFAEPMVNRSQQAPDNPPASQEDVVDTTWRVIE